VFDIKIVPVLERSTDNTEVEYICLQICRYSNLVEIR